MKKRFTNMWDIRFSQQPLKLPPGFGLRRVRGEGTRRFRRERTVRIESGVSPVPRQPPQSKTLSRVREMSASHDCHE